MCFPRNSHQNQYIVESRPGARICMLWEAIWVLFGGLGGSWEHLGESRGVCGAGYGLVWDFRVCLGRPGILRRPPGEGNDLVWALLAQGRLWSGILGYVRRGQGFCDGHPERVTTWFGPYWRHAVLSGRILCADVLLIRNHSTPLGSHQAQVDCLFSLCPCQRI